MKKKITRPRPTPPKMTLEEKQAEWQEIEDLNYFEYLDEIERKKQGPSPEAQKLLNKKVIKK